MGIPFDFVQGVRGWSKCDVCHGYNELRGFGSPNERVSAHQLCRCVEWDFRSSDQRERDEYKAALERIAAGGMDAVEYAKAVLGDDD